MTRAGLLGAVLALPLVWVTDGAFAQVVICNESDDMSAMMECMRSSARQADADLNAAYEAALAATEGDATKMLEDAQVSWVAFKDAACAAEVDMVRAGAMQPLVFNRCLERLTRDRTRDLELFVQPNMGLEVPAQ